MPQKTYLPLGDLRTVVLYPHAVAPPTDNQLSAILRRCGLGGMTDRLDEVAPWDRVLSGGERQRVAFARHAGASDHDAEVISVGVCTTPRSTEALGLDGKLYLSTIIKDRCLRACRARRGIVVGLAKATGTKGRRECSKASEARRLSRISSIPGFGHGDGATRQSNMERQLRIGIIAHLKHAIREPFAGGLEMHTFMLQSALRSRGHEVTVFASSRSEPESCIEAICDETSLIEVGCDEAPDKVFFQEHHAYLSLMNGLRSRPFDLIHNNSLHYLPVAMADALPMPIVTTLHTPPFAWLESGVRLCRARQATFVAVSESIRRSWSRVAPVDHVIMNGINLDRFAFQAAPAAEPYLVWYGRIVPEKGLHHAIAAAELIGAALRIAGPVSDQDYFDREVGPRLSERVRYLGHLSHDELAAVVGGARAFLCTPCWEEPYGLVVAEALACGVPVAAFARGAIPELLDSKCGVLATPDDPRSLGQAALAAQRLDRRACRARAERRCDAERMIDEYEELYADMIGNGTFRPAASVVSFVDAAKSLHGLLRPTQSAGEAAAQTAV